MMPCWNALNNKHKTCETCMDMIYDINTDLTKQGTTMQHVQYNREKH